jgi:Concanavalin A-like lectin/glucanases superfamily
LIPTNDTPWPVYTPAPINTHHGLNRGRVLWWLAVPPLDGGGTYWDLCGNYPGTLTSMTSLAANGWRPPVGSRYPHLQFDGATSQVTSAYAGLSGASQFSMACWGKRATASSLGVAVGAIDNGDHRAAVYLFNDGKFYFVFTNSAYATASSNDTNWHRLLAVFDGTQSTNSGRFQCYSDGQALSLSFTGTIPSTAPAISNNFQVGRDPANGNAAYTGAVGDVSIWNRPLIASEAWADYELSLLGYPDVLNRWRPTATIFASGALPTSAAMAKAAGADILVAIAAFKAPSTLSKTESHDILTAAGTFATAATIGPTERHDTSAIAGAFNAPGSIARTESHDTSTVAGSFTAPAALSKTAGSDTTSIAALSINASPGAIAGVGRNDTLSALGIFASSGGLTSTERHDVLAVLGLLTSPAVLARTERHDVFAGTDAIPFFEPSIDPFGATIVPVSVADPIANLFDAYSATLGLVSVADPIANLFDPFAASLILL